MRYLNSFIITSIIYLIATFFLFFAFADAIIKPEPKEVKIALNEINFVEEKPSLPIQSEKPIQKEVKPKLEKKVEKPKIEKKQELVKYSNEKYQEQTTQKSESTVENNIAQTTPISTPTKHTNEKEVENLEATYLAKLTNLIEKNKNYPKSAKRLNQTGKVHVTFMITKDGKIKNCKILKGSEFESLDQAALEILLNIANFEPIPNELNKESWEITVPIIYQIARS